MNFDADCTTNIQVQLPSTADKMKSVIKQSIQFLSKIKVIYCT